MADPLGNAWTYEYDEAGHLLSRTDPNGNAVAIEYDESGRRTGFVDGHGRAWPMRYDSTGRLTTLVDPDSNTVGVEWSDRGDLVATVDEIGRRTRYLYDQAGNLVERKTKRGLVVERGYDYKGQLLHETDPLGPSVQLEYDALGRVTSEIWRDRGRILYEHDAEGNVTKITDACGRITRFEYGRFNKVLKCLHPGEPASETIQEFDSENRLKTVVYPGGRRAEYAYDADGRIISKLCVDGRRLNYVRNPAGFVTEVQDACGVIANYEHDGLGQIIKRKTIDGEQTTFAYDPSGRLIGASNESGEIAMDYDFCGRVIAESGPHSALVKEFDAAGRQVKSVFNEELTCGTRYEEGVVTFATAAGSTRADYDTYGRLESLKFLNGTAERYTYQSSRRPHIVIRNKEEIRYDYDAAACVTAVASSKGNKKWFERDAQRRLVAATRNGTSPATTVRFRYDAQGNRSRDNDVFRFAPGNRLAGTARENFKYDLRGRLVERHRAEGGRTDYHYTAEGLLKEVIRGADRVCFRYDALGRRISKTVNGNETRYGWE
jgi:YD repeat-containing protein